MPVVPASDANIREAAALLRRGGVVAFPTETVYGLGADALDARACARVFEIKRRPRFDPLIVHVGALPELRGLCRLDDPRVERLAAAFWPGPLTLVLPRTDAVPDLVCAGLPTVAVRVPAHPVARALIQEAGRPIAAPSANPFGFISPTLAAHVEEQLGDAVDLVLDGGPCAFGLESTIVDLSGEVAVLLRPGATEVERLEAILGPLARPRRSEAPRAPGQLESHYAPRTPIRLLPDAAGAAPAGARLGLLAFREPDPGVAATYAVVEVLSPDGDLGEAAAGLFAAMHRLDRAGLTGIVAEPVPPSGLGLAILDRLRRAAADHAR